MASKLTKTTKSVKKFLTFFAITVVIIIVADYLIKSTEPITPVDSNPNYKYYPAKNITYNKIPYPKILGLSVANPTKIKVSKDLVKFPDFPPVVNIYKVRAEQEHINDSNHARDLANVLDLTSGESKIISNVMYFETLNADRTLSFDKVQRSWEYKVKYTSLSNLGLGDTETIKNIALKFMGNMDFNTANNFETEGATAYITNLNNQGVYTNIINNNANSSRILLNKKIELIKPINDKIPVLYSYVLRPNYLEGIANMTIINKGDKIAKDMIAFSYKAHDYETTVGIYPILTPTEAFEKIQNDGGFLYSMSEQKSNFFLKGTNPVIQEFKLNINSTRLVYLEATNRSEQEPWSVYLQPFYQFSGQAKSTTNKTYDFSFIVPALQDDYYTGL